MDWSWPCLVGGCRIALDPMQVQAVQETPDGVGVWIANKMFKFAAPYDEVVGELQANT